MNTVTNTTKVTELEYQYQLLLQMIVDGTLDINERNFMLTAIGSELAAARKEEA